MIINKHNFEARAMIIDVITILAVALTLGMAVFFIMHYQR
jgi:hypothetical protein